MVAHEMVRAVVVVIVAKVETNAKLITPLWIMLSRYNLFQKYKPSLGTVLFMPIKQSIIS